MDRVDCLIVGAGIGGGVLALALGQRGYRVLVLEREATAPVLGRPEVLAGSTVSAIQRWGGGAQLFAEALMPLQGLEVRQAGGRRLLTITPQDLQQAQVQPYSTDPVRTRRILLERAEATGLVQVQRGVEVQALLRDEAQVVGVIAQRQNERFEVRARLVVGDDGTHSRVRQELGIPISLQKFAVEFLVPREALSEPSPPLGRAWINPAGLRQGIAAGMVMPLPTGRSAMALIVRAGIGERLRQSPPSEFQRAVDQLSPECSALASRAAFPEQWVCIQRPFGHATRYLEDGAALLGDAAHPVTPVGGQGANMSVADALVLAEVVHEGLVRGDCSAERLQRYETIRRPANERSLRFSQRAQQIFGLLIGVPWLAQLVPWFIAHNDQPKAKARFLRTIATAFVSPSV